MPRPSAGTVSQAKSRTALFAFIAARLHGVPTAAHDDFFRQEVGVAVGRNGAEDASRPYRHLSPRKARRGRGVARCVARVPALREWLLVDEQRFDLETVLIRFPGDGARQSDLIAMLADLPGVRQVVETAPRRDVYAIAVLRDQRARRRLRARLEEVATRMFWDEILSETHEPALGTWINLTRAAAVEERFLIDP